MPEKVHRVVQWATGNIGKASIRHIVDNPAMELVGVLVTDPDKVGKDAGHIAGIADVHVAATDDKDAIVALEADCVHFAPLVPDIDMVCRLLRSGKNVVSPVGPFHPTEHVRADVEKIEAACRDGGVSFHGSGIHPGFAGDILPLTLARLTGRIDHVHVYEIVDFLAHPSPWMERMGFGRDPEDLAANPSRSPDAIHHFAQSMAMIAEGLGKSIDGLKSETTFAIAQKDIAHPNGDIPAGTVAGQHYEWTALADGKPLITFHTVWAVGREDMEPAWDHGDGRYRIIIDGEPSLELTLDDNRDGGSLTAYAGLTAIPAVCAAAPGFVTHLGLGVVRPRGLIR
ncbi:NAD(P)H-dependent amine dehydrogenase family protein [Yinghuangia sp. YIM S10712]|uniref:NAD(P)H-dependent amine dehydrogenase family protein n=1 Tax=Yinghuangia sp. YIM S10712 TaxID=3436930 RepID=UPI003F52FF98